MNFESLIESLNKLYVTTLSSFSLVTTSLIQFFPTGALSQYSSG